MSDQQYDETQQQVDDDAAAAAEAEAADADEEPPSFVPTPAPGKKRPLPPPSAMVDVNEDVDPAPAPVPKRVAPARVPDPASRKRPAMPPADEEYAPPAAKRPAATSRTTGAPVPNAEKMKALVAASVKAAAETKAKEEEASKPKLMPALTEERDPHMLYPDTYSTFDPDKVVAEGDPQTSKVGGGKMLFISYIYPDGVQKALCVQAPKLFMPGGIKEFKNKEGGEKIDTNALCSLGKDWQQNPQMVAFKDLCDGINLACARLAVTKKMNLPYCKTAEDVLASSAKICFSSEKWTEEEEPRKIEYPPSIKLKVNKSDNDKSLLVSRIATKDGPRYGEVSSSAVAKGSQIIPMVNFRWLYRKQKQAPAAWGFNVCTSIYQAVIEPPAALGSGASSRLAIVSM